MFKVNSKNTWTTSTSFWCFYCKFWTYFTFFSTVSIVDFEQVNVSWAWLQVSNLMALNFAYHLSWWKCLIAKLWFFSKAPWKLQQIKSKLCMHVNNPTNIYLFTVNNRNTKKRCEICSKLQLVPAIFYQIFIFHQIMALQKLWKMFFYFIWKALFFLEIFKFLYFRLHLFFFSVSHCFRGWSKKNLKVYDVINCLNKNLITHFVWYLEKEIRCDIETLSIDIELNKERFCGIIMQKMCTKS